MEFFPQVLSALSSAIGAVSGSVTIGRWLVGYLRDRTKDKRTTEVLAFLRDLGCMSEAEVRALVDAWNPPTPVGAEVRTELGDLLTNLVRGARFHTTQGTPLSSYL